MALVAAGVLVLVGSTSAAARGAMSLALWPPTTPFGLGFWTAALALAVGAALVLWPGRDAGRWQRGAAGEVATAALLARLAPRAWVVFHDLALPGSSANIDHLAIGPTGVWVVDSKAFRSHVRWRRGRLWAGATEVPAHALRWETEVVSLALGAPARAVMAVHCPCRPFGRGLPRRGRRYGGVLVVRADRLVKRLK